MTDDRRKNDPNPKTKHESTAMSVSYKCAPMQGLRDTSNLQLASVQNPYSTRRVRKIAGCEIGQLTAKQYQSMEHCYMYVSLPLTV